MNILFLGDSITDCDHNFTSDSLGNGYVKMTAALRPDITAVNGGADGFTFMQTLRKWKQMYAENRYDAAVITGGINETGIVMDTGTDTVQAGAFLSRAQEALGCLLTGLLHQGAAKILLIEPFLFPVPQYRSLWFPVLEDMRRRIQKTASGFSPDTVIYIPVQNQLNALSSRFGVSFVSGDGIHLTAAGNECLSRIVCEALFRSRF